MENDDVMSRIRARMAIVRSFDYAPMLERIRAREREKWERIEREKAEKREAKEREKAEKREARKSRRLTEVDKKLRGVYRGMLKRCGQYRAGRNYRDAETYKSYRNYGGRGIKVCDEWLNDPNAFYAWALTNGYRVGLQIDRKDNNAGYSPDNCWFVTRSRNMRNTRKTLRLEDGTPFIDWYEAHVEIAYENGRSTTKYKRLACAFRRGGMSEVLKTINKINGL